MKIESRKEEVIAKIISDFSTYTREELLAFDWIRVEEDPDMAGNVFWDNKGMYVLFAKDRVVWY
jgi:hypothetical protein